MRTNLIETLLRFADGTRATEEDPITEVLAWLLANEPALLDCFCHLLARPASERQARGFRLVRPSVRTQVVVPRIGGGTSRYDLLLEAGRVRAVVELKVRAGLTASGAVDVDAQPDPRQRHQIDDYLALAKQAPEGVEQLVFALAVGFVDVGADARDHRCWGGCLTWQTVHDAFARRLRLRSAEQIDSATRMIAEQLLGVMEVRRMATPRMTLDGAISVRRASRFRQSIAATFEAVWQELHADGTLDGFTKISRAAWQDDDKLARTGYRLWASPTDTNQFGFMGMYYGEETIVEDVPDLCFFLQAKPDSRAGEALLEQSTAIAQRLATLDTRNPQVRWYHEPGGWTSVWCATSLAQLVLDGDPGTSIKTFFRSTVMAARELGLLEIYFEAVKRAG